MISEVAGEIVMYNGSRGGVTDTITGVLTTLDNLDAPDERLTTKIKIRCKLYWDSLHYAGVNSESARDEGEPQVREQEVLDLIERDAVLMGF